MSGAAPGPEEVLIGLDIGTTAVKAVAFHLASGRQVCAVHEYPLLEPNPGWQVQDPDVVASAVLAALHEVARRAADLASTRISWTGIAVSAAMHGLIALDADHRPLTPLVTWADGRAADEARALHASGQAQRLHLATGTPVHPMSPLAKLLWFGRHEPTLVARTRWWVGLKDYVLLRLTGTLVTELSSASGTGLLHLATRRWSPEALELAGISPDQLPEVLPTTAVLPLSATGAGLPTGTPVVVGAADGPMGNLGTGAMTVGTVGLSLGTSGAARMVLPHPTVDPSGRLFCYALTDDCWVAGGAVSNGGIVARWARDVFDPGASDGDLLARAGAVAPGSDGLAMVPYLLPERAPLWDPGIAGAYVGVRRGHTPQHFVRAAVEGVCLQLSTVVDQLDRIEPVREVRATGGTLRSPLWRASLAGALGRPLTVTADAGGSALGAAALGLLALDRAADLGSAVSSLTVENSTECEPVDPGVAAVFGRLRVMLGEHLRSLLPLAELYAGAAAAPPAQPLPAGPPGNVLPG